ncbi:hypothetical protein SSPO_013790 [Streptomyces antimycoticus]|uniref:Uncharacterized protein n=1 Tax=Streptomyces antimycoticus TaxID=68175 RepID=A0A499UNF8_9ACTN|nr:hypothetical protein [Streptomyces antimycoticus]BBJ38661.1 hypothetical protein SSPO_013790 [Streptomyces antimycoticus]
MTVVATVLATAAAIAAGPARATPDDTPSAGSARPSLVRPIDPQQWRNPDDMTWADYRAVPGTRWADPDVKPTQRTFKGALVLLDYRDEEFTVSRPAGSTLFGNPQASASDIPRARLPRFYQDFLNIPGPLNNGHTINEYWMEDSGGRIGVDLTAFGVYRMPGKSYQYGVEDSMNPGACPAGTPATRTSGPTARPPGWPMSAPTRRTRSTSSSTSRPDRTSRPPGRSSAR